MKKTVLITGGTGFIGKKLTQLLVEKGFRVGILSRNEKENQQDIFYYKWNLDTNFIDENAVLNADYIVHLAGEGIADKPWTEQRKKEILESRAQSVALIFEVLKKKNKKIEAFISASGIGIYGAKNGEEICMETTKPEDDFLGTTCQKWEAAANTIESLGIRTVKIRTGLVMGKAGFLGKLVPVFKYKMGAVLGSGKQYMPWIHLEDLCAIYLEAIENEKFSGAYNAAIFDDTTNEIFSKTLAKIYGYSLWLPPIPSFLIRLVLGKMGQILLAGRRVSSAKIEEMGFEFRFKNLENALRNCLGK